MLVVLFFVGATNVIKVTQINIITVITVILLNIMALVSTAVIFCLAVPSKKIFWKKMIEMTVVFIVATIIIIATS
jgi:hypothetical protein